MNIANFLNTLLSRFDKKELGRLDGWRGFLAFLVVIAHANQIFILPIIGVKNYVNWGFGVVAHFAVLGFFVISGIAITMSLVLNIIRNKNQLNYREYTISRISRIHPPLIFSILTCIGYYVIIWVFNLPFRLDGDLYVARERFYFTFSDILATITFERASLVRVNGPLWSLIIEWWIYFVALVFIGVFYAKGYLKVFLILILILLLGKINQMDAFVYLALWLVGSVYYLFGKKYEFLSNALLILSIIGLWITNYYTQFFENRIDLSTQPIVQILFSLSFIGLVLKFPARTIFNAMSKYSYTIYIIHFPFFLFVFSIFHKSTQGSLPLNILLSTASIIIILYVAYKSHLIFENKKKYAAMLDQWVDKAVLFIKINMPLPTKLK